MCMSTVNRCTGVKSRKEDAKEIWMPLQPCHKNRYVNIPHVRRARGSFLMKTWPPDSNGAKNFQFNRQKVAHQGPRLGQIYFFHQIFKQETKTSPWLKFQIFGCQIGPIWAFGPSFNVYDQINPNFPFLYTSSWVLYADKLWKKSAQIWAKFCPNFKFIYVRELRPSNTSYKCD